MQIAVWLRWETGIQTPSVFSGRQIFFNKLFYEIKTSGHFAAWFNIVVRLSGYLVFFHGKYCVEILSYKINKKNRPAQLLAP